MKLVFPDLEERGGGGGEEDQRGLAKPVPILLPTWPEDFGVRFGHDSGDSDEVSTRGRRRLLLRVPRPRWTNRRVAFGEFCALQYSIRTRAYIPSLHDRCRGRIRKGNTNFYYIQCIPVRILFKFIEELTIPYTLGGYCTTVQ